MFANITENSAQIFSFLSLPAAKSDWKIQALSTVTEITWTAKYRGRGRYRGRNLFFQKADPDTDLDPELIIGVNGLFGAETKPD
jgi:hypothetical protein